MNTTPPEITEISIVPIRPHNGLVAFASITFNNQLRLHNIGVYTNIQHSGFRLTYPLHTLPTGKKINAFFPINQDTGKAIAEAVSAEMEKIINKNVK